MGESAALVVEMIDETIVVTLPGTDFFASYRKRQNVGEIAAHFMRDDRYAALRRSEFVARSWRLALTKARELGWVL